MMDRSEASAAPRAAFFDLDHTVLRVDSSASWMRFSRRRGELSWLYPLRALWWGLGYKLALIDLDALADGLVAELRGESVADISARVQIWQRELSAEVHEAARMAIAGHDGGGDLVVLLTGASQLAAEGIARLLGIEHVLCTELEAEDGRFTGRMRQRCFGQYKLEVAERWAVSRGIDLGASVFYTDSYNDLPMLSRVGRPIAVNPDLRLRRHARKRGWPIQRW